MEHCDTFVSMITRRVVVQDKIPVTKAAEVLQISRVYAYELIEKGELKAERYGPKSMLILRESLIDYLRRRGASVVLHGDELTITKVNVTLDLEKIKEFCERWGVEELALFGSVLREDFGPQSDVDVLVRFSPEANVSLLSYMEMVHELEGLFGRKVDLVTGRSIEESQNPIRRQEILSTAEVIYETAA